MDHPERAGSPRTILVCTVALGLVWIYMGLVPKLLFPETGEMEMMKGSKMFGGFESTVLVLIGIGEILFGVVIMLVRKRIVHVLSIIGLICLAMGALAGKPEVYTQPFNPFAITVPMVALSLVVMKNLPPRFARGNI